MIQGIRRKFILIAMAVLSGAMILLAGVINLSNWINVNTELQQTMTDLLENGVQDSGPGYGKKGRSRHMQNTLDESRYFLADQSRGGAVRITGVSKTTERTMEEMSAIVEEALAQGKARGSVGSYRYLLRSSEQGGSTAVFLDCETKMESLRSLLLISALACLGFILIAWALVALFSRRAIHPLVKNAIQQKQFITDAGHELKTPLTVISANMDVLSMKAPEEDGEEWIRSTRQEVARMRSLVDDLIYLSRLDEDGATLPLEPTDLSALVLREAEPFQGMAEFAGKSLEVDAQPDISLPGNEKALSRLVSQLCDNAVKYAPQGDVIRLSLSREKHGIRLMTENGLTAPLSQENIAHLFDRFYRPDVSRSRESGGYGIGLSMIRAIAEKHEGKARAELTGAGRLRLICDFHSPFSS